MKKTYLIPIIILLVVGLVVFIIVRSSSNRTPSKEESLAQCLSDKGAKFYGAYWCPHCQNQKLAFGRRATKKLPYVECALYPTEVAGIKKKVLAEYKAGTYTGGYLDQLKEVETTIANNANLTPEQRSEAEASGAKILTSIDDWEPTQTEACVEKKIDGYPTWIFADGSTKNGEISLSDLASAAQCTYESQ